jgi:hypothetical protein
MNWKDLNHWIYGLVAAVITSACTTLLATVGANVTGDPLNWHQVFTVAGSSGFIGAVAYLKQSPLPGNGGQ